MTYTNQEAVSLLGEPLRLPCGAVLKNRLIKSAMSDSLGDGIGNTTDAQIQLYEHWAHGGTALSLIGEVQTNPFYAEKPGNLVLDDGTDIQTIQALAERGSANGTHIWPQLGHAGALAHIPVSSPKGPSALDVEGLQCDGMTLADIQQLPSLYARSAVLAQQAGFGGVQIHAGHGFLFSQFLSPLFNHRTDGYGGSVEGRFRVIGEVIDAVRLAVGDSYPIGIKINSTDNLEGGLTKEDALEVVRMLDDKSIDLIDVSGGTYFPGAASSSDDASSSGPYFTDFGKRAKAITSAPVMLTGGFRSRDQAVAAIKNGCADAISLGRAMALNVNLANNWLNNTNLNPVFPKFDNPPSGGITAWYTMRLTAIAEDPDAAFTLSPAEALTIYETRDAERSERWIQQHPLT